MSYTLSIFRLNAVTTKVPLKSLTACWWYAGEGFKSWSLPHLTSISLQNGWRVSDEGMQALGSCQAPLRYLNMKGCRLVSNTGLAALVRLSHLTHLSLQVGTAQQNQIA